MSPQLAQVQLRFAHAKKVPRKQPENTNPIKTKIRDYDQKMGSKLILCDQVRNNPRRHEMSADRDVGVELTDEFHQGSGIKAIQHQAHAVGLPWLVTLFIPPAEEIRSRLN